MSKLQYKINLTKKQKERMNNNKTKNPRAWQSLFLLSALSVLLFGSCSNDTDAVTAEIALTTPVVELGGVSASASRAAGADFKDVASGVLAYLCLHDTEERKENRKGGFLFSNPSWTVVKTVSVTHGPGVYRAGMYAYVSLKANQSNGIPPISNAVYGYRGSVQVESDGSFTPSGALQPYSAAVMVNLHDANGTFIEKPGYNYSIDYVGLACFNGFASDNADQSFPNGTSEPIPGAAEAGSELYYDVVNGRICPGTYPATWTYNSPLQTLPVPEQSWELFKITYCNDGFDGLEPKGPFTIWTVSYPAQLTLESGKLYTFNITLGKDAHITLDAQNAVSIAEWNEGSTINVGR